MNTTNATATAIEKKLDLFVYVTGSEEEAIANCLLISGSGTMKDLTVTMKGKHEAVLTSICNMLEEKIRVRDMTIGLSTNSTWLMNQLGPDGRYRKLTEAERIAEYGKGSVDLFHRMAKLLINMKNKIAMHDEETTKGLELAKAAALFELRKLKAARATVDTEETQEA